MKQTNPNPNYQKAEVSKVGWAIYMARFLINLFYFCSSPKRTGKKSIGPRLNVNEQAQAHNEQSFDHQNVKAEKRVQIVVMIVKPTHTSSRWAGA